MKQRLNTIEKISNIALFGMFVFFVASFWIDALSIYSSACICMVYICTFLKIRLATTQKHWPLFAICLTSICWTFVNALYPFAFSTVISNFFIYLYLNLTAKISSGKWNKYLMLVGVFGVLGQVINILTDVVWFIFISLGLQILALMKYLDPLLEKVALQRRAKRLGVDYETVLEEYQKKSS